MKQKALIKAFLITTKDGNPISEEDFKRLSEHMEERQQMYFDDKLNHIAYNNMSDIKRMIKKVVYDVGLKIELVNNLKFKITKKAILVMPEENSAVFNCYVASTSLAAIAKEDSYFPTQFIMVKKPIELTESLEYKISRSESLFDVEKTDYDFI